jgi:hypothetical protein
MSMVSHISCGVDFHFQFFGFVIQHNVKHFFAFNRNDWFALKGCPNEMIVKSPIGHIHIPFADESASADFHALRQGFSPPNQRMEYTPGMAQFGGDKFSSRFVAYAN